jgi:hypothetical protein
MAWTSERDHSSAKKWIGYRVRYSTCDSWNLMTSGTRERWR